MKDTEGDKSVNREVHTRTIMVRLKSGADRNRFFQQVKNSGNKHTINSANSEQNVKES